MAERKIKMGAFKNFRAKMRRIKALYKEAKELDILYAGWRYQLGAPSYVPVEKYDVSPYSIGKSRGACTVGNRDLVVTTAEVPLLALGDFGEDIIDSYGKDRINTDTLVGVTIGIPDYFVEPASTDGDLATQCDASAIPPMTQEEAIKWAKHCSRRSRGEEVPI